MRPIAIGMTLRRLASSHCFSSYSAILKQSFEPFQLGVGVARGLEVGVHVARNFLYNLSPGQALIKLDFKNAFNSIRRDAVLEAVNLSLPSSYPFVHAAYASDSFLFFGGDTLLSQEGVQQGDPLGPLLLSLTTSPLLTSR